MNNSRVIQSRSGTVAVLGRPNVGKSTFLNAATGVDLAIVADTPGTTRTTLLGVAHRTLKNGDVCEFRMLDTPGLHQGETKLSRHMMRSAEQAAAEADVVLVMIDVKLKEGGTLEPHPRDLELIASVRSTSRVVIAINKIDTLKDKSALFSLLTALADECPDAELIPVSAKRKDGVERILEAIGNLLPEGEHTYEEDDLTDKPTRFFASEFVREQILRRARKEVPHATAVSIDSYEEGPSKTHIACTIHVERGGQKGIIIGAKGEMLKDIGSSARKRIEEFIGRSVHLTLFVRETPGWRDDTRWLDELGYETTGADRAPKKPKPPTPPRSARPESFEPKNDKPRSEKPKSERPRSEKPRTEKPPAGNPYRSNVKTAKLHAKPKPGDKPREGKPGGKPTPSPNGKPGTKPDGKPSSRPSTKPNGKSNGKSHGTPSSHKKPKRSPK